MIDRVGQHELVALANTRMPFGRYKGRYLVRLPEEYLLWFEQRGFPDGELGRKLAAMLELKVNGLEKLLEPLILSANHGR